MSKCEAYCHCDPKINLIAFIFSAGIGVILGFMPAAPPPRLPTLATLLHLLFKTAAKRILDKAVRPPPLSAAFTPKANSQHSLLARLMKSSILSAFSARRFIPLYLVWPLAMFPRDAAADLLITPGVSALTFTPNIDDGISAGRTLGLTSFSFFGTAQTTVGVSTNGNLNFISDTAYTNTALPAGIARIDPFWDDLVVVAGSSVVEKTSAGNYYTATWQGVGSYLTPTTASGSYNFQAALFGATQTIGGFTFQASDIAFSYGTMTVGTVAVSATVGLNQGNSIGFAALPGTSDGSIANTSLLPTGTGFVLYRPNSNGGYASAILATGGGAATHWKGQTGTSWFGQNWASNAAGTSTGVLPTSTTDLVFSATGAGNKNTTLGVDFTIKSLTISDTAAVTIGGSNTLTLSGISGSGIDVQNGAGLLTVSSNLTLAGSSNTISVNNAAGAVISGVIGGSNGLKKTGSGILTLSGANNYTGATDISGGKLVVSSAGTINTTSAITISGGALVYNSATALSKTVSFLGTGGTLSGGGTITNAVTVTSGNTYSPGSIGDPGTQTLSGGVTFDSGSIFSWDLDASAAASGTTPNQGTYDRVTGNGAGSGIFQVVLGSNLFTDAFWDTSKSWDNIFSGTDPIFSIFGGGDGVSTVAADGLVAGQGSFTYSGGTLSWVAVPESSTALAGLLLGAGLLRRKR